MGRINPVEGEKPVLVFAPKWLNMHGSIVSYPGRVFGDDLAILG